MSIFNIAHDDAPVETPAETPAEETTSTTPEAPVATS